MRSTLAAVDALSNFIFRRNRRSTRYFVRDAETGELIAGSFAAHQQALEACPVGKVCLIEKEDAITEYHYERVVRDNSGITVEQDFVVHVST